MKKSEGLFKLFYLRQSLVHHLKKASVAFPLDAAALQSVEQRGVGLEWSFKDEKVAQSHH